MGTAGEETSTGTNSVGEPAEPGPCVAYQGCDPGYDVVWCLHQQSPAGIGTHTWPSFAAQRIWSYFAAHGA